MNIYILDLLVVGLLLLAVTLGSGWIRRLPLSYALIYLLVGILLGPYGFKLVQLRPDAEFLERLTELVVLVSLFSCGLKMNRPLRFRAWESTFRLIGLLLPLSIVALAALAHYLLGLDWGPAILLAAILSPTDPVLASEVQLSHLEDRDELRFGLTSEGGLNDALAFPFVYFGLYALKDNNWQNWLGNWFRVDVLWAISAGIVLGILVARLIIRIDSLLQRFRRVDQLMEDFVALSTVLITYAVTELFNGYGFIAVFVAGVTVQRAHPEPEKPESQLHFMERIEKLLEVGTILVLGTLLRGKPLLQYAPQALLIAVALLFVIRPLATWLSTLGNRFHISKRLLFGWFGIRGVGSLYYLSYAFGQGLRGEVGERLAWITYATIVFSVILHGVTATPLMNWYEYQLERRRQLRAHEPRLLPEQQG